MRKTRYRLRRNDFCGCGGVYIHENETMDEEGGNMSSVEGGGGSFDREKVEKEFGL